jgi:hypothetical protein
MRYQQADMSAFLMGPDARRVCTLAAGAALAKARAIVGKDSGDTARSGHLQHGIGGRTNDRVRVSVVFGGAAPSQQFGPGASRFLTRALEGN